MEYHHARSCLRLIGPDDAIDIPIEVLVSLNVDMVNSRRWLLFGGRRLRGGSKDLVGIFRTETAAITAFHELRQEMDGDGWGEVLVLDPNGQRRQRLWFDTEGALPPHKWTRRSTR